MQHLPQGFQTVKNRGVRLRTAVRVIPSNDLLQERTITVKITNGKPRSFVIPAGTLWRSNRAHAKETNGVSTHARYDDLYDLLRSGRHAVHQYAAHESSGVGETAEIREDVETARAFVRYVLAAGVVEAEEKAVFEKMQTQLVADYVAKRNDDKRTARVQFVRGMVMTDATGRNNPPAAAMVSGAGIGHLLKRLAEIPKISTCMDRRTVQVYAYIQSHMDLYRELWEDLRVGTKPRSQGLFQRWEIAAASDARRSRSILRSMLQRLREYRMAFDAIKARPFCKNAAHTVRDLDAAIAACEAGDLKGLRTTLAKVRRGIRWVFVMDALQVEVIGRLSYLLNRLGREETKRRRGIPRDKRSRFIRITRDMAPDDFAAVEAALTSFLHRLDSCSDQLLDRPVKADVERLVREAEGAMRVDDWRLAKKRLIAAAKYL